MTMLPKGVLQNNGNRLGFLSITELYDKNI